MKLTNTNRNTLLSELSNVDFTKDFYLNVTFYSSALPDGEQKINGRLKPTDEVLQNENEIAMWAGIPHDGLERTPRTTIVLTPASTNHIDIALQIDRDDAATAKLELLHASSDTVRWTTTMEVDRVSVDGYDISFLLINNLNLDSDGIVPEYNNTTVPPLRRE